MLGLGEALVCCGLVAHLNGCLGMPCLPVSPRIHVLLLIQSLHYLGLALSNIHFVCRGAPCLCECQCPYRVSDISLDEEIIELLTPCLTPATVLFKQRYIMAPPVVWAPSTSTYPRHESMCQTVLTMN